MSLAGLGLLKGIKDAGQLSLIHADPGVIDLQANGLACRFTRQADRDTTRFGEFDGIANQVMQDLPHTHRVAHDLVLITQLIHALQTQLLVLCADARQSHNLMHQMHKIERSLFDGHMSRIDLGEIEQIIEHGQQVLARALDQAQTLRGGVLGHIFFHDPSQPQHTAQWGADLMADGGQETALGFADLFGFGSRLFTLLGHHL